jgi:hypothetical protein
MSERRPPVIPPELIEYLDEVFPDSLDSISPGLLPAEIWARWGERRCVKHLKALFKQQTENILET